MDNSFSNNWSTISSGGIWFLKLAAVWNDSTRCLVLNLVVTCNFGEVVRLGESGSEMGCCFGGGRWSFERP